MLSDREKMVLHFCCFITIAKLGDLPHRGPVIENMVTDVRNERCRSLSEEDIETLLDEINQEMIGGRNMFNYLIDETFDRKDPQRQGDEDWR